MATYEVYSPNTAGYCPPNGTYYATHYYAPNYYYQPYPYRSYQPVPYTPPAYVPPAVIINNPGVSEERLREIVREEIERGKKK